MRGMGSTTHILGPMRFGYRRPAIQDTIELPELMVMNTLHRFFRARTWLFDRLRPVVPRERAGRRLASDDDDQHRFARLLHPSGLSHGGRARQREQAHMIVSIRNLR